MAENSSNSGTLSFVPPPPSIEASAGSFPVPEAEDNSNDLTNLAALAKLYSKRGAKSNRGTRILHSGKYPQPDLSVLQLLNTIYDDNVIDMFLRAGQRKG